jgi:hypothetical protein
MQPRDFEWRFALKTDPDSGALTMGAVE